MVNTHFDLVLGPFWAPGGPKRAIWAQSLNFYGQCFVELFCFKYSLWCVQRNDWLIQHCYSPCGTTQLEKTGKKVFFGPRKAPFGALEILGGSRVDRFGPNCPRLARLV